MRIQLSSLMEKKVSRGEFLGLLGLALVSVLGLGTLLKLLTGKSLEHSATTPRFGYGASAYGGTHGSR